MEKLKRRFEACDADKLYTFHKIVKYMQRIMIEIQDMEADEAKQIRYELEDILIRQKAEILNCHVGDFDKRTKKVEKITIQDLLLLIIAETMHKSIDRSKHETRKAIEFNEPVQNGMVRIKDTPIFEYSCSKLLCIAIPQFLKVLKDLPGYHIDYYVYWQLLEYRAVELMIHSGSRDIYDHKAYCEAGEFENEFVMNNAYKKDLVTIIRGVRIHFISHNLFPHELPPSKLISEKCLESVKKFIKIESTKITGDRKRMAIHNAFLLANLNIGEIEAYKREFPESIPTVTLLLKNRGVKTEHDNLTKESYPGDRIPLVVSESIDYVPETLFMRCFMTVVLTNYFYSRFKLDWALYVVDQRSIFVALEELEIEEHPRIVETFYRHQLYYKGRCYEHNSYLCAFIHWMFIIQKDFDMCIYGNDLRNAYSDISLNFNEEEEEEEEKVASSSSSSSE